MSEVYEDAYMDNTIIGYESGYIIIEKDDGDLFFLEAPADLLPIGETVAENELTPLNELPIEIQMKVYQKYKFQGE